MNHFQIQRFGRYMHRMPGFAPSPPISSSFRSLFTYPRRTRFGSTACSDCTRCSSTQRKWDSRPSESDSTAGEWIRYLKARKEPYVTKFEYTNPRGEEVMLNFKGNGSPCYHTFVSGTFNGNIMRSFHSNMKDNVLAFAFTFQSEDDSGNMCFETESELAIARLQNVVCE